MSCTLSNFEPQLTLLGQRTCGAAALCMAYRALGMACVQEEVWQRLTQSPAVLGGVRSHLLAADARSRGLAALVVQTGDPWPFLKSCHAANVRAILNHRLTERSPWGHFSLLTGIDETTVWLHDPQFGPNRTYSPAQIVSLWSARPGRSEIAGQVAVLIARGDGDSTLKICRNCNSGIDLFPFNEAISPAGRPLWRRIYCPTCDVAFSSNMASPFSPVVTFDGND